jgi:hypothetical protein
MPATIAHALTMTTPDDPAYENKPSNWNQTHALTLDASGSEIIGAFSNANGLSFGLSAGAVTASHNAMTTAAQSNHSHGNPQLNLTNLSGTTASNSAGFTLSLSAGAGGAGDGVNILAAGTQTANTTGTVVFSNSNGITFGMSNSSIITAQHNAITTGMASNRGSDFVQATAAFAGTSASGTIASNGISVSIGPYITTAMLSNAVTLSNIRISGGTTSNLLSALTFGDANGISFGLNASTMTASHNGLTSQSNQNVTAGNGGFAFQTLSFSNVNGISFGTSAGSAITASHNALTSQSNQAFSADASSTFQTLTFQNSNGVSFSNNAGALRVTHDLMFSTSRPAFSADASSTFQTLTFQNSNGVSFSNNAGAVRITHDLAFSSQTNNTGRIYVTAQSTGQSSSSTYDLRTLSIIPDGIISAGWSGGSFRISATQSNQNVTAGNGGFAFQTLSFSNLNGISFGTSAGSAITASHNALTTARASNDAVGLNTAQTNVTWTVNSSGLSFNAAGYAGTGTSATNASITLNSNGLQISVAAPGGGGAINVSAGTTSGNVQTLQFNDGNGISFGLNGSTVTASHNAITTAALSNHSHGNPTLALTNLSGTTASASNGFTLSLSAAAAGGGVTVSAFENRVRISAAGTVMGNSLVSIQPFYVKNYVAASFVRLAGSINVATAANNSSAYVDASMSGVVYSRNGSTLSSMFSFSNSFTQTWSSNASQTVTGVKALTATFAQVTVTPGEYWMAVHMSTTNSATGGANTTALANSVSMIISQTYETVAHAIKAWGGQSDQTQGLIYGQGLISSGATRDSIGLSLVTVSGTRGFLAGLYFGLRANTWQV